MSFYERYTAATTIAEKNEIESEMFQVSRQLEAAGLIDGTALNQVTRYEVDMGGWWAEIERVCKAVDAAMPIDPELPPGFDDTPNDQRPDSHQVWWHRPYIVTDRLEPETFGQYQERLAALGYEPDYTPEQWRELQQQRRADWLAAWPSGVRYCVRCLDGGAWDRSTNYGMFASLSDAVSRALDLSR